MGERPFSPTEFNKIDAVVKAIALLPGAEVMAAEEHPHNRMIVLGHTILGRSISFPVLRLADVFMPREQKRPVADIVRQNGADYQAAPCQSFTLITNLGGVLAVRSELTPAIDHFRHTTDGFGARAARKNRLDVIKFYESKIVSPNTADGKHPRIEASYAFNVSSSLEFCNGFSENLKILLDPILKQ